MIYFVSAGKGVKIGITADEDSLSRLIAFMQQWNIHEVKRLNLIEGSENVLKKVKAHFQDHHVRGDWFKHCDSMVGYEYRKPRKPINYIHKYGKKPPFKKMQAGDTAILPFNGWGWLKLSYAVDPWQWVEFADKTGERFIKITRVK